MSRPSGKVREDCFILVVFCYVQESRNLEQNCFLQTPMITSINDDGDRDQRDDDGDDDGDDD